MKLKNIIFVSIFVFLFSLSFASASLIYESYQETADIISEDKAHITIKIFIDVAVFEDSFTFFLIPGIENLKVSFDETEIEVCTVSEKIGKTEIVCNFENPISGKHFLKAEYDSSYPLIKINQNRLMFRSGYNPIIKTKDFIFVLKLPLGHIIPDEPGRDESFFINPEADALYSDGQRIILRWQEKNLDKIFDVSVISEPLKSEFNVQLFILILVLVIIIIILFFMYLLKKKTKIIKKAEERIRKKKVKPKSEIIEEHLIESEKAIINELKNIEKKELWQKQLQIATGFSKSKLSRLIINLESRNLIQKIPFGNTNKIKLKIK